MDVHTVVVVTIVAALAFDVINGFHDAANSIATIVSTRVLSPRLAVLWAAFFNFVALWIFGTGVAKTISGIITIKPDDHAFVWVVLCGLIRRHHLEPAHVVVGPAVVVVARADRWRRRRRRGLRRVEHPGVEEDLSW
jgi:hypothetical protein